MITGKYINVFIICILAAAIIFIGTWALAPKRADEAVQLSQPEYASELFDKSKIISIEIKADESDWANMLENATKEEYISCDVTINGTTFKSVGIRPKGNSSLSSVANSDSDRFSFKLEFDHFIDGQTCFGLDKFVINNIQSDATYMKDYLSYDLMTYMGVKTPLFAYTDVAVNGKAWGFYIAVEAMEESFAQRNYGEDYGMLYKPEGMGARGNGKMQDFLNNNGGNAGNAGGENLNSGGGMPGGGMNGGSSGGTDLKYTDGNIDSYSDIFDNEVFKGDDTDYNRVIEALKNLSNGTELEKYINVDETLRYFAVNTVLVNLDSYFSSMKHNYYLYEKDGQLSMLPWDYNLAFGGFQSGSAGTAVNFPIDTPVSGIEMSERPILARLLEVDEYMDKYHEYLQEIVDNYFNGGVYEDTINTVDSLISQYVKNDASAFYTYEQYSQALPMLKEFGRLRAESIQGQLDGSIPSTTEGQANASGKLVDASAINLSAMGAQGGGGGGFGAGGDQGGRQGGRMGRQNDTNGGQQAGGQENTQQGLPQDGFQPPEGMQQNGGTAGGERPDMGGRQQNGFGMGAPGQQQTAAGGLTGKTDLLIIAGSGLILIAGLVFVVRFKRRKYA